jgi:hypothetical protein
MVKRHNKGYDDPMDGMGLFDAFRTEPAMTSTLIPPFRVSDVVRVIHDVPQVGLRGGEIGVVQSLWFEPDQAYEVEFHGGGIGLPLRVILYGDALSLENQPPRHDGIRLG